MTTNRHTFDDVMALVYAMREDALVDAQVRRVVRDMGADEGAADITCARWALARHGRVTVARTVA